jgi:hypothetical protein
MHYSAPAIVTMHYSAPAKVTINYSAHAILNFLLQHSFNSNNYNSRLDAMFITRSTNIIFLFHQCRQQICNEQCRATSVWNTRSAILCILSLMIYMCCTTFIVLKFSTKLQLEPEVLKQFFPPKIQWLYQNYSFHKPGNHTSFLTDEMPVWPHISFWN